MFLLVTGKILLCATLTVGAEAPVGGQSARVGTLAHALAILAAADSDRDGRISAAEARAIPVSAEIFAAEDDDKDGSWSRDEFLVFYRHQLVATHQPIGADLEAEITRVQALKRVEAVDAGRKPRCETSARSADAGLVTQRFETALADVEAKCALRRATRDDFQRLRNLVVLNGRAASRDSAGALSPAAQSSVLATIDSIEKRASLGQEAREDFASLQRIARSVGGSAPEPAGTTSPTGGRTSAVQAPSKLRGPASPSLTAPSPGTSAPAATPPPTGPAETRQRAQSKAPSPVERPVVRPVPPKVSAPPPRPAPVQPQKDAPDRSKP